VSRRFLTVAAIAALVLPVATLEAQVGFGVAGGYSAPLGDFGKIAQSGYHITGLVNLSIPLAPAGFRFEGSFSEYDYERVVSTASSSKARILYATANGILSTPGLLGPYLIGGLGMYHATAECTGCTTSSTKVGFNGGGGFKIGLAGLAVFAEARFHYVPGASDPTTAGIKSSTQFIPVSVGITF
jgi:hypothetical protein